MLLPILQKQKPKLSSVLRLPRNHKASKWQGRDCSLSLGLLSAAPSYSVEAQTGCIESKFDVLSFELNSVSQGLKL